MNRQERRQKERQSKKDIAIMYKQSDFEKMFEETKRKTTELVVKGLVAAFAMSLNDEYGFHTKRIARVLESTKRKYEAMVTDHLTQEDVMQWCEENNISIE